MNGNKRRTKRGFGLESPGFTGGNRALFSVPFSRLAGKEKVNSTRCFALERKREAR